MVMLTSPQRKTRVKKAGILIGTYLMTSGTFSCHGQFTWNALRFKICVCKKKSHDNFLNVWLLKKNHFIGISQLSNDAVYKKEHQGWHGMPTVHSAMGQGHETCSRDIMFLLKHVSHIFLLQLLSKEKTDTFVTFVTWQVTMTPLTTWEWYFEQNFAQ